MLLNFSLTKCHKTLEYLSVADLICVYISYYMPECVRWLSGEGKTCNGYIFCEMLPVSLKAKFINAIVNKKCVISFFDRLQSMHISFSSVFLKRN